MNIQQVECRISRLENAVDELTTHLLDVETSTDIHDQYESRLKLIEALKAIKEQLNDDRTLSYYE